MFWFFVCYAATQLALKITAGKHTSGVQYEGSPQNPDQIEQHVSCVCVALFSKTNICPESLRFRGFFATYLCVLLCFIKPILGKLLRSRTGVTCERARQVDTHPRFRNAGVHPHPVLLPTIWWPDAYTSPTLLAILVPSSSTSNGPTTTPLTTRGFCHVGSAVWASPKFVRPHW